MTTDRNITAPARAPESAGKERPAASILLVEDDISVSIVLETRLESFGYRICGVVRSGAEAIEAAFRRHPDLVLMDILLEGEMNGIEAAREIGGRCDVPIIFLSCLGENEVIDSAVRTNPYGYMVKPWDNSQLRSSIEIALVRHQAHLERERLIRRLEHALQEVKRLSGLLPICASCKKIRDGEGGWHPLESYISNHSEANFTHGLCPDCMKDFHPRHLDGDE